MSLDFIRKMYGVPAKRLGRVEYTGGAEPRSGTITGALAGCLRVRMDGHKHSAKYHPTWMLRYLDAPEPEAGRQQGGA